MRGTRVACCSSRSSRVGIVRSSATPLTRLTTRSGPASRDRFAAAIQHTGDGPSPSGRAHRLLPHQLSADAAPRSSGRYAELPRSSRCGGLFVPGWFASGWPGTGSSSASSGRTAAGHRANTSIRAFVAARGEDGRRHPRRWPFFGESETHKGITLGCTIPRTTSRTISARRSPIEGTAFAAFAVLSGFFFFGLSRRHRFTFPPAGAPSWSAPPSVTWCSGWSRSGSCS